MKRKWLALSLSAVMALSALGGCAPNSSSSGTPAASGTSGEPVNLTFWYWEDLEGMHKDILESKWKKYAPDINVKFESIPQSSYHDKLITAMSSNTGPDVFKMYPSWLTELKGMNALEDLTDEVSKWEVLPEIPKAEMDTAYARQDRLYSLPFCNVVLYLYCRADHFKEVGLNYPTNMQEFYEACEKLTRDTNGDGKIDTYGFSMRGAKGGQDMWASLVLNSLKGADYVDENDVPMLTNSTLVKANEMYLNIFKNGWAPPSAPTDGFEQTVQNFKSGVASMLIHHVGSSTGMLEAVGKENLAVVPVPTGDGGKYVPSIPSSIGVYSSSKQKEATLKFAKWLTSPEIHDIISDNVDMVPWMESVQKLDKYQSDPFMKISIDSLPDSKMLPPVPNMGQFTEKIWPQTMQRALLGEISSEQMMQILSDSLK